MALLKTTKMRSMELYHMLFVLLLCIIGFARSEVPDSPPITNWYIEKPDFRADRLDLYLEYPISDYVPVENLDWIVYAGLQCGSSLNDVVTNENYLDISFGLNDPTQPTGGGSGWRLLTMSIKFDPETIRGSPVLTRSGREERLQLCVRLGAYSSPTNIDGAFEIYYKETAIDLVISDDGEFDLDEETGLYRLRGYLCDQDNNEIIDPAPIFQGMPVKACVTPDDEALANNVYMRSIDSFFWTRESIYQPAIRPSQMAAPLTEIDCEPGRLVCSFVTLLRADFFYKLGRVSGVGFGWLQFGTEATDRRGMKAVIAFDMESDENIAIGSSLSLRQADQTGNYPNFAGSGTFEVDLPVTRLYRAYGYLCDKDNNELDAKANPIPQGSKARVCVTPDEIAIRQDNVRIRSLNSFEWNRYDLEYKQIAIEADEQAVERTEVFCQSGSKVCAFETKFQDNFYESVGPVYGNGIVWLQFGDDSRRRMAVEFELGRRERTTSLQSRQSAQRSLQYGLEDFQFGASFLPYMEPGFAGASPYEIIVYLLLPIENRETYSCRAYQCDFDNREIVDSKRQEGDILRMCVAPSYEAQQQGVKMWSVEWWQWSQTEQRTQDAIIPQGKEATDGKTVAFCYRGMDVCTFTTRLRSLFFSPPQPNYLFGNGVCWLTFGDGATFPAAIELDESSGSKVDPTSDPLYAGKSDIGIVFETNGNYTADPNECPPEDHTIRGWWEEQDGIMRAICIGSIVTVSSGICCIWCLCLFCRRRDRRVAQDGKPIILNVDIDERHNNFESIEKHDVDEGQRTTSYTRMDNESIEENENDTPKFSGKPGKRDICFDDEDHPGTKRIRRIVRRLIEEDPERYYGPKMLKKIKKSAGECFFVERKKSPKCEWAVLSNTRLVSTLGNIWMEEKKKIKALDGEFTREDLEDKIRGKGEEKDRSGRQKSKPPREKTKDSQARRARDESRGREKKSQKKR